MPTALQNEMRVYRSEFKYKHSMQGIEEQLIGKVTVNRLHSIISPCIDIFHFSSKSESYQIAYRIQGNCTQKFKSMLLPQSLSSKCPSLFKIIDLQGTPISKVAPTTFGDENQTKKNKGSKKEKIKTNFNEGEIIKKSRGVAKEVLGYSSSYHLRFPPMDSVGGQDRIKNTKTLLVAGVMLLDMNFFDRKCCLPLLCI